MKYTLPLSKLILVVAALVAVVIFLFPPWMELYRNENGLPSKISHGYHFILNKPAAAYPKAGDGVTRETSRMVPRLAILAAVTFILYHLAQRKEKRASHIPS